MPLLWAVLGDIQIIHMIHGRRIMEVIAVINQKGGVAKTTTAHALAAGLALEGFRVLMVDLDGQKSLTLVTGAKAGSHTALEVLTRKAKAAQAITHTASGDIIAASDGLGAADTMLKDTGREYRLKEALKPLNKDYDYCVIDCPPSLGILTINALTAANSCIVPAQADFLSLQAIGQLEQTLKAVKAYTNRELRIKGILITRYSARAVLSREAVEMIQAKAAELRTKVFEAKIRESVSLKEAQAVRQSIYAYAPKSNGAKDYKAFIAEIVKEA